MTGAEPWICDRCTAGLCADTHGLHWTGEDAGCPHARWTDDVMVALCGCTVVAWPAPPPEAGGLPYGTVTPIRDVS